MFIGLGAIVGITASIILTADKWVALGRALNTHETFDDLLRAELASDNALMN